MSKIFFIASNVAEEPYVVYPLGMGVVSNALMNAGHEVVQYDFLERGKSLSELLERVMKYEPDFICVSIRNIDGCDSLAPVGSWFLDNIKQIVDTVRQVCNAPMICGGPGFSIMPEKILNFIGADYGVEGEGERAICDLISALEHGENPPKIIDGSSFPLLGDDQASSIYLPELVNFYQAGSGIMGVQTKRGCPFKCSYCTYPLIEGRQFRPRNPIRVVDDLEKLQQAHGCNQFFFTDSVFNDKDGHYLEVVKELIRRNLGVKWGSFFSPRSADLDKLPMMLASGLSNIELGTDGACDTTLKAMRKGFTFDDVYRFNEACVDRKIPVAHYIVFGGPDESMATVREGIENIATLRSCVVFSNIGLRILPGTPLQQRAIKEGLIGPKDDLLRPVYYISPMLDAAELEQELTIKFKRDITRVFPPSEGIRGMNLAKKHGLNGVIWDTLIKFD